MKVLVAALVAAALFIVALATAPARRRARRRQLRAAPFPPEWDAFLTEHVSLYRRLPEPQRRRLQQSMQVFLGEKKFVGCKGLAVDAGMRLAIASQACLLIMNRTDADYDAVSSVLVYPTSFFVEHEMVDEAGVLSRHRRLLSGESWGEGQVILSWDDARPEVSELFDGENVVIHEFAHQLDEASGEFNGAPALPNAAAYARWSRALHAAFEQLEATLAAGGESSLDSYAATEPGEFFAVASEVFFERPIQLAAEFPDLYSVFHDFFRVDPAEWWK